MKVGSLAVFVGSGRQLTPAEQAVKDMAISRGFKFPVKGDICTVRGFTPTGKGLYIEEIVNPYVKTIFGYIEQGYVIECFRELLPPQAIEELIGSALTDPTPEQIVNA